MADSVISIVVKPNSPDDVVGYDASGGFYRVCVKASPHNNKANLQVVKLLSRFFGRPVRIMRGATGRKKLVRLL